ncbi:hypothetical protein ACTHQ2_26230, partial [Bacillus subtilis]|uniref:hypothetical protein n=1 Tax=Bacillus subtilis TaxID=1423 RepID=UPI003F7BBF33
MNSKLLSLSLTTINYIALNGISKELPTANELIDEQPFASLVVEQIDRWINEVDNQEDEEPEILTILRLDIETELIEGNYLEHGVAAFIERVKSYFGDDTNGAYTKMLIDVAKELN